MLPAIMSILGWLGGGPLNRILRTVDKRIEAETDREALKAEIIKTHYATRGKFMRAGGFWLMLIFAVPLGCWWAAVLAYSVFWCQGCAYPQTWHIAALPAPLDDWAGMVVMSIFGVLGIDRLKK